MASSSNMADQEAAQLSYEDLALLEEEFDDADLEIMRKQYDLTAPLYVKRSLAIKKIPNFWGLVLEQAPLEIDQYIQPQDSRIFAESLTNIEVRRPQLDNKGRGDPRSLSIKFEFKANEDFEDKVIEKTFWNRRAKDGWMGLVSEPVKIHWKKGKDLTQGLTDGACALFEARKKKGDMTSTDLPEYHKLKKQVESDNGANTSFFTWFGWVSGRRYVSADENEEATAKYLEEKAKRQAGSAAQPPTKAEIEAEIAAADDHDEDVEVHQAGEMLAVAFAEELWPQALKLFTDAQEGGDVSDEEFEDDDMDGDLDSDIEGGDDDAPVDIRALVHGKGEAKGRRESGGPPSKKVKR